MLISARERAELKTTILSDTALWALTRSILLSGLALRTRTGLVIS